MLSSYRRAEHGVLMAWWRASIGRIRRLTVSLGPCCRNALSERHLHHWWSAFFRVMAFLARERSGSSCYVSIEVELMNTIATIASFSLTTSSPVHFIPQKPRPVDVLVSCR